MRCTIWAITVACAGCGSRGLPLGSPPRDLVEDEGTHWSLFRQSDCYGIAGQSARTEYWSKTCFLPLEFRTQQYGWAESVVSVALNRDVTASLLRVSDGLVIRAFDTTSGFEVMEISGVEVLDHAYLEPIGGPGFIMHWSANDGRICERSLDLGVEGLWWVDEAQCRTPTDVDSDCVQRVHENVQYRACQAGKSSVELTSQDSEGPALTVFGDGELILRPGRDEIVIRKQRLVYSWGGGQCMTASIPPRHDILDFETGLNGCPSLLVQKPGQSPYLIDLW